jgi:hypothetical protein
MFTRFLAGDFLSLGQSIVVAKLYISRISSPSLSQKLFLYPAPNSNFSLLLSISSSCLNQHSFCCSERGKKKDKESCLLSEEDVRSLISHFHILRSIRHGIDTFLWQRTQQHF